MRLQAEFPHKLGFLFEPHAYKVAYGGRGSAKSWSFARALLLIGVREQIRVICAREVQKSIKDSVKKLLDDQIELLGLSEHYESLTTEIRGKNGTEFSFSGLSDQTTDSIKSFEGCTHCWVEEAQTVTSRSWEILDPTIRADNSEIWVTFNPQLETDPTYQFFIVNPPPDTVAVEMNYMDNPWFNEKMESKRLHCKETNPVGYPNIWEGNLRPAVEGAIYYKQVEEAQLQGRICNVPYDPMLKVHLVFDLGHADSMAIGCVQKVSSEIRIINYIEDNRKTLDWYSSELKDLHYNWGKVWIPHDGFSSDYKTGKSTYQILKALGWDVVKRHDMIELSVEEGIKNARLGFHRVYFDKTNTTRLVECLKRYRRSINRSTGAEGKPLHDEYSDGADMFRYLMLAEGSMTNEIDKKPFRPVMRPSMPFDAVIGI